jgi:hypothetical protein
MTNREQRRHSVPRRLENTRVVVATMLAPVVAGALAGTTSAVISATPAAAATFPGYTTSYYILTTTTTAIGDAGCQDATSSATGPHNVILDMGEQLPNSSSGTGWGTEVINTSIALPDYDGTSPSVLKAYKAFANGWRFCAPSLTAWLGLGTNNDGPYVGATTGKNWGGLVSLEVAHFKATNIQPRGANDIELAWNGAGPTKHWIGGTSPAGQGSAGTAGFQASGHDYFDYGAATGCNTTCSNSWTDLGVYDKDYGYAGAVSIPEFYTEGQGEDWYAVDSSGHTPYYSGATATGGGNTPEAAWNDLAFFTGQDAGSVTTIQGL